MYDHHTISNLVFVPFFLSLTERTKECIWRSDPGGAGTPRTTKKEAVLTIVVFLHQRYYVLTSFFFAFNLVLLFAPPVAVMSRSWVCTNTNEHCTHRHLVPCQSYNHQINQSQKVRWQWVLYLTPLQSTQSRTIIFRKEDVSALFIRLLCGHWSLHFFEDWW